MKRSTSLPPRRGGNEGGETGSRNAPTSQILHARHPPLDPSPEGKEIAPLMKRAHQASSQTVSK
jgi:hypothetical protein